MVDIYHSPLFTVPIVKVRAYVMTLRDVIPLTHPELVPEAFRALFAGSGGDRTKAAREPGLSRRGLQIKMKRYGIT